MARTISSRTTSPLSSSIGRTCRGSLRRSKPVRRRAFGHGCVWWSFANNRVWSIARPVERRCRCSQSHDRLFRGMSSPILLNRTSGLMHKSLARARLICRRFSGRIRRVPSLGSFVRATSSPRPITSLVWSRHSTSAAVPVSTFRSNRTRSNPRGDLEPRPPRKSRCQSIARGSFAPAPAAASKSWCAGSNRANCRPRQASERLTSPGLASRSPATRAGRAGTHARSRRCPTRG